MSYGPDKDVFDAWLSQVADARTQAKIAVRINRLAAGNFGDRKSCANVYTKCESIGGPGYRVYYTMLGKALALLLCGRRQTLAIL